jgi:hypothetical protein
MGMMSLRFDTPRIIRTRRPSSASLPIQNVSANYLAKTEPKKVTLGDLLDKVFDELEGGSDDADAENSASDDVEMADGDGTP